MLWFRDKQGRQKRNIPFWENSPPFDICNRCSHVSWQHIKKLTNVFEVLLETKSFSSSNTFAPQELPLSISEPENTEI